MKIALRITIDVDPQTWADEYGVDRDEVRDDVRRYVQTALSAMPVEPDAVTIK